MISNYKISSMMNVSHMVAQKGCIKRNFLPSSKGGGSVMTTEPDNSDVDGDMTGDEQFQFVQSKYTGKWEGWDFAVNKNGPVRTYKSVNLWCDLDGVLSGRVSWRAGSDLGFNGEGDSVKEDSEDVIGMIELPTGIISLVEKEESGSFTGSIILDKLHLRQTQPGLQPVVAIMQLPKISSFPDFKLSDVAGSYPNDIGGDYTIVNAPGDNMMQFCAKIGPASSLDLSFKIIKGEAIFTTPSDIRSWDIGGNGVLPKIYFSQGVMKVLHLQLESTFKRGPSLSPEGIEEGPFEVSSNVGCDDCVHPEAFQKLAALGDKAVGEAKINGEWVPFSFRVRWFAPDENGPYRFGILTDKDEINSFDWAREFSFFFVQKDVDGIVLSKCDAAWITYGAIQFGQPPN